MAKIQSAFTCTSCGNESFKWLGRCNLCHEWNSFEEQTSKIKGNKSVKKANIAIAIDKVQIEKYEKYSSGMSEFDRVMGGGLPQDGLILLTGQPGIGKSSLLLQVCDNLIKTNPGLKVLYISGEESSSQIVGRCRRLKLTLNDFLLMNEKKLEVIIETITEHRPDLIIIDSIQTTYSVELASSEGSIAQIKEVTSELVSFVKNRGLTCFLVGHVTKEGNIAGPKLLEHMVDTVLGFEGEKDNKYRALRSYKNRYGSTSEVGMFEMSELGLLEIKDPEMHFIKSLKRDTVGSSVTCVFEGAKELFVEVQCLVVKSSLDNLKRSSLGVESNRFNMLIAIIEKYTQIKLSKYDIYLNVTEGFKLSSRESDLAIVAAIISSYFNKPLLANSFFIGEIGLNGRVRSKYQKPSKNRTDKLLKPVMISEINDLSYFFKEKVS